MTENPSLPALRTNFLESGTTSMPIAGLIFWSLALVASRFLNPHQLAFAVGFGSGTVFPLGLLIDRLRGRKPQSDPSNPVTKLFLQCLVTVAMLWPLVILAGSVAPGLVVLGGAVLMGIVWVYYGWCADDPTGMHHAIARTCGCYAAYLLVPLPWKLTAICAVPICCYLYSLTAMKRPGVRI